MNRYLVAPACTCCSITPDGIIMSPKGVAREWKAHFGACRLKYLLGDQYKAAFHFVAERYIGHVFGHMSTDRTKSPIPKWQKR